MSKAKGGLGKGLGALLAGADTAAAPTPDSQNTPENVDKGTSVTGGLAGYLEVAPALIVPNPQQPRTEFDQEALAELVASIREVGVLQPPVVRELGDGRYELIMGERRLRACKELGLERIPVIVRATSDDAMLRDALLENLHRQQLNPLEEAGAYQQLMADFGATHEQLADRIGRSRPQITNTIRLLNLPPAVQRRVAAGVLSAGHARALLGLADVSAQEALAARIVHEGLSVRAVEELVAMGKAGGASARKARPPKGPKPQDDRWRELADNLGDRLDTRVRVEQPRAGKGSITIEVADPEDLSRIASLILGS